MPVLVANMNILPAVSVTLVEAMGVPSLEPHPITKRFPVMTLRVVDTPATPLLYWPVEAALEKIGPPDPNVGRKNKDPAPSMTTQMQIPKSA